MKKKGPPAPTQRKLALDDKGYYLIWLRASAAKKKKTLALSQRKPALDDRDYYLIWLRASVAKKKKLSRSPKENRFWMIGVII